MGDLTPPSTPPGWYPDPDEPGRERYWDGSAWAVDVRPKGCREPQPPAAQVARPARAPLPAAGWVALGAAALMIIGALGPWKKALGGVVTVSGTDGGGDGVYVIVMALVLAASVAGHYLRPAEWKGIVGALIAAFVVVTAVVDYGDIKSGARGPLRDTITAGWGLWLVGIAGVVAVIASVMLAIAGRRAARAANMTGP